MSLPVIELPPDKSMREFLIGYFQAALSYAARGGRLPWEGISQDPVVSHFRRVIIAELVQRQRVDTKKLAQEMATMRGFNLEALERAAQEVSARIVVEMKAMRTLDPNLFKVRKK